MITTDLGLVTAYAEAVAQGYTGTKEEFGKLLANYAKTAEKVAEDKVVAEQAMKSAKESANRASTSEQNAKASENAAAEQAKNVSDNITELVREKDEALQIISDKTFESVNTVKRQEKVSTQNVTDHTDSEIQRMTQETAESKSLLDRSITEANNAKSQVDASVEVGDRAKNDLDKLITDSSKVKTDLDESIATANKGKSALGETVGQANALNTSLGSKIAEGTQLNKDITASGQKAVSDINSASTKVLEDINATGAAKLDAVNKAAEAIVADREQITKNKTDITSLNEDLGNIISPNLFNPAEAKKNTAINQDDGTEMPFDGWLATGYIPVSKGDILYFSSNGELTPYSTGAFYDKDKQRVDSFGNPNNNTNITVTSDGYARFSFDFKREKLQIEKGSRTAYIPYGELKVKAEVDKLNKHLAQIENDVVGKNLLNPDTVTIGKRMYIDGSVHTQESDFYTDFIAVKPNQHIYASFLNNTGNFVRSQIRHICAYDASKTVLPSKGQSDIGYDYLVPDGVAYIVVTFMENDNINHRQLEVSDTGITSFKEYFAPYTELKVQAQIDKNTSGVKRLNEEKANGKGISFSINESGGLRVTYDDGK